MDAIEVKMINLAVEFPLSFISVELVYIVKIRTQDNRLFENNTAFEQ